MKNKLLRLSKYVVGLGAVAAAPVMVFAQATTGGNPTFCGPGGTINDIPSFICKLDQILGTLLPFLITLGIIYFVWGVISYVIAGDEEAKTKGRDRMIYGIIGLVVIVGVWGLVKWVSSTFGLNNTTIVNYPTIQY